jgi:arylsulfatase A-like enzyme
LIAGEPETPRLAYADQINKYDLVNRSISRERPKDDLLYCAMDRTWKLIYRHSRPEESELYNLARDPHELHNLHAQHPDQVSRLRAALDEHAGYVTGPFAGPGAPDASVLKHLKALGYVGNADEEQDEGDPNTARPDDQATTRPTAQP